jgi:hypothetical protein
MKDKITVADRLIIRNINNNMARKTTLLVLLLMAFVLPPAVAEADARSAQSKRPVLGLGILGGVALTAEPVGPGYPSGFFTPKAQLVGALSALLDITLFSSLSLGIGFQLHGITASSLDGGWSYPGHWGGGLRLSAGYGFELTEPSRPLQLRLGASAGGSFNFDLQSFTTLFFFYPGIFLEPYLELDSSKREKCSMAIVLPIDYYFRRDYEFYGSIGIGVVWRYTLQ